MKSRQQQDVQAWHERVNHPVAPFPQNIDIKTAVFRTELLVEEGVTEYLKAVMEGNLIEVADALADAMWIILGTAVAHGIELDSIFEIVSASNYSKFDADGNPVPHPTIPGKIGKSEWYWEPAEMIGKALAKQVAEAVG